VTFPPQEEGDSAPVPVPAKGYIEGDHAYDDCPDDEDCHMLIFDRGASRLYELFQAHKNGNSWDGYLALWKLDKAYPPSNRGQGCSSADAAGLPIAPGLIGYKETKKGAINHALRFIIRNDFIRGHGGDKNTPSVAYPASHGSTAGGAATGIPYGGRLRLKSTIQESDPRLKTPGAKAIVRALQKYGMILADGGNIPLVAESVKVYQDQNAAETWEGLLGPRDLAFIKPDDFEVIAIPKGVPGGTPGWYASRAEYEGQLKKPLGCDEIVQP
jgi:serine/threonine-protein kinase